MVLSNLICFCTYLQLIFVRTFNLFLFVLTTYFLFFVFYYLFRFQALVLVLRVFPSVIGHVLPFIPRFWHRVSDDSEARAAVIWMLGEHGQDVPEAPYLLESAVSGYNQVKSSEVKKSQEKTD